MTAVSSSFLTARRSSLRRNQNGTASWKSFVKEELTEDLTPASLETLSIVAYLGPISRVRIEYLRGVNSSVILRSLMIRGLIERFADPEHPGPPQLSPL